MTAFLLANALITDRAGFDPSSHLAVDVATGDFGARLLVDGGPVEELDGTLGLDYVLLLEFSDEGTLSAFMASAAHRKAARERTRIASVQSVLLLAAAIHGIDEPRGAWPRPAYVLADTVITSPERHLTGWLPRGRPLHRSYGGRIIGISSRDTLGKTPELLSAPDHPVSLEGGWVLNRVLLNEFPDLERAQAFVHSDGFNEGRAVRAAAGTYRFAVLQGVPQPAA